MGLFNDCEDLQETFEWIVDVSKTCNNIYKKACEENKELAAAMDVPFTVPTSGMTKWVKTFNELVAKLVKGNKAAFNTKEHLNKGQDIQDLFDHDRPSVLGVIEHLARKYTKARITPGYRKGITPKKINLAHFIYTDFPPFLAQQNFSLALYWLNTEAPGTPDEKFHQALYTLNKCGVHDYVITPFIILLGEQNTNTQRARLLDSILLFVSWYEKMKASFSVKNYTPPGWFYVGTAEKFIKMFYEYICDIWGGDFVVFPKPVTDDPEKSLFRNYLEWLKLNFSVDFFPKEQTKFVPRVTPNYKQTKEELRLKVTDHQKWRAEVMPKITAAGYSQE
jgi:hypothetical protein